ncbi:hypothetical protein [Photorhabdus heterorhabditis]|uniref:hypothetical protein n=1 Tax=Photorhabdus heterorhabditis TaxID=880156 RepID=UPI001562C950|nr:hypothetical protein [Photorhabdus heterorhabditis]NRN26727.1 hypothetical protein [Photorhabdus heterorhabditis subsp. aluminescens]
MNHYLSSKMTVKEFNKKYPIGSEFYYSSLIGKDSIRHVVTRSAAWKLGHGDIVVSVEGMTGGVNITHLEPIMVDVQVEALAGVTNGADIYSYPLAIQLRAIERDFPSYILICEPQVYNGDGTDTMPYFGAITTLEGNRYLNQLRDAGIIKSQGFIALNSIRSRQQRGRIKDE